MKPLTHFEMHELTQAMTKGDSGAPVGSLWRAVASPNIFFIVLMHANLPTSDGPMPCLAMQSIPSGEIWIQPTEEFTQAEWESVGFVWDRDNAD